MNKSQSAGMYIVLAIVALVFISSVFMSGPVTQTTEISYTSFLTKLANKDFKVIQKADDYIIAIPKVQPTTQKMTKTPSTEDPFGLVEKKLPQVQYRVLTPGGAPDFIRKIEASGAELVVKKPGEASQLVGLLGSLILPLLFIVFLLLMAKSIQAGGTQAM